MKTKQTGFTIVELLIVIVIIGILAALVIVAYNGIQNRSYDSAVRSDLNNVAKKIKIYGIENGSYPQGNAQLATLGLKVNKSAYGNHMFNTISYYNFVYCWPNAANPESFALVAASRSGNVFEYTGGSVRQASYALSGGSTTVCTNANNPMDTGSERDWLYDNNAWQTYVAG